MIAVDLAGSTRFVPRAAVCWAEAQGDYARLHMAGGGSHLIRTPLAVLQAEWGPAGFIRVHRGYLVALNRIVELRSVDGGYRIRVSGQPVGRRPAGQPPAPADAQAAVAGRPAARPVTDRHPPRRVRVVLADRRPAPLPVLRGAEVAEQTEIGRELVRGLVRAQLAASLRIAGVALALFAPLPALFALVPACRTCGSWVFR